MEPVKVLSNFQARIKARNSGIVRDFDLYEGNVTNVVLLLQDTYNVSRNTVRNVLRKAGKIGKFTTNTSKNPKI